MMRRSGARPAVKRWKLCSEILRRAASGHIEATQLSKFAAASRIAEAVISGWPDAPSSPLQGGGALTGVGACACAETAGRGAAGVVGPALRTGRVKILSNRLKGPPPPEACARASPHSNSAAATRAAPVRLFANGRIRRAMFHPLPENTRLSGGPVRVSSRLTRWDFSGGRDRTKPRADRSPVPNYHKRGWEQGSARQIVEVRQAASPQHPPLF